MRSLVFAVVVVVAACSGSKPGGDAGNKCIGNMMSPPFDLCSTEHDCLSQKCQLFTTPAPGFQVCTVACSAATPCPNDSSGAPATCTALGVCQPVAANACHL